MTTHDWHQGYSAGALLRLVALALRECASINDEAWEQNDCFRTLVNTLADGAEWRARNLDREGYDVVSELSHGILLTLRTLYGAFHPRADYLVCRLAFQQPDWIDTMKRRQHWLAAVQEDKEGMK